MDSCTDSFVVDIAWSSFRIDNHSDRGMVISFLTGTAPVQSIKSRVTYPLFTYCDVMVL